MDNVVPCMSYAFHFLTCPLPIFSLTAGCYLLVFPGKVVQVHPTTMVNDMLYKKVLVGRCGTSVHNGMQPRVSVL